MLLLILLSTIFPVSSAGVTTTPQQITWFYANNLTTGARFFKETLQLLEVTNLIQKDKCRIFHSTNSPSAYLGVCNTRPAPTCKHGSDGNTVATTYTFVAENETRVNTIHNFLTKMNNTKLIVTVASGSPNIWGAYGFNFYDTNVDTGLGCYRFEVQSFIDQAWPQDTFDAMENQLILAGEQLGKEDVPKNAVHCECSDYCSGRCFAPSCQPCSSSVWNGDPASCTNAGPLGSGLLCSDPISNEMPCCQPNGTACNLGKQWCDCSQYPTETPLFPPLSHRLYKGGKCVQRA